MGPDCSRNVCELYEPCRENKTKCLLNVETLHGYECKCVAEKCHLPSAHIKCPASWWGSPVCGPCNCPIRKGFSPNCDKKTGKCLCKASFRMAPPEIQNSLNVVDRKQIKMNDRNELTFNNLALN